MSAGEIATIGGFIMVIAGGVFTFGGLKTKLDNSCERQREDREEHAKMHDREGKETREKFQELYTSRNSMNEAIVKLSTLIEQIFKETASINAKIDKAIEDRN